MRFIILLLLAGFGLAQEGPELAWTSTPVEGFAEFRGILQDGGRLLTWGDTGADSVRQAQFHWLDDATGAVTAAWTDAGPRSRFHAAAQSPSGILLVGEARRNGGDSRALLMHLDAQGDSLWLGEEDWGGACALHAATALEDGGWLVGGERDQQALLARLDVQGDTLWTRSFEFFPNYEDVFYDVAELPDGRLVACGQTFHDSHEWTSRYAVLCWFDEAGELLDLFQPYDAQMFDVQPLSDGRLALTGDFQFAYLPVWLGTNSQDMIHHYFGVRERDMQGTTIRQCPDGGLAVGGRWQTAEGEMGALLLRLDAQGGERWRSSYDICGIDMAWGLLSAEDGSHRLAGFCMPSRTAFVLRTLDESSPVPPARQTSPEGPSLLATREGFHLLWARPLERGSVELFNLLGQRVRQLSIPPGASTLDISLGGLAAGSYILLLDTPTGNRSHLLQWRP